MKIVYENSYVWWFYFINIVRLDFSQILQSLTFKQDHKLPEIIGNAFFENNVLYFYNYISISIFLSIDFVKLY